MTKTLHRVRITTIEFIDIRASSPEDAITLALAAPSEEWLLEASQVSTQLEESDVPVSREA